MSDNKASGGKFTVPVVISALVAVGLIFMNKGFNADSIKEAAQTAANMAQAPSESASMNPLKAAEDALKEANKMTTEQLSGIAPAAGEAAEKAAATVAAQATEMATNTEAKAQEAAAKTSEVIATAASASSKKLPNGTEIKTSDAGIEAKLMAFIEDKSKPADKNTWFDFDRLAFDAGKASLAPTSQEQLKNVAEIMNAYPSVKIKIGGYTDNSGKAEDNMKLSQARAETVKAEIIKMGVPAERISAEGYGSQYPVASNDSEEGRSKNRRIAARIVEK